MRKIVNIIILCGIVFTCKAQSPVLDISAREGLKSLTGAYYKDINNVLNPFEGTYIYTDGNITLKIVLQKKTMSYNSRYYEDLLIGEYQCIENGIEKINTLSRLNVNYTDQRNHSIGGGFIITHDDPSCDGCLPNEKALYGGLAESATDNLAVLIIRRISENNVPAIKIFVGWNMRYKRVSDPELLPPSFPSGDYTLVKQL